MGSISDFISAVAESKLLTTLQKQEFLAKPELFPDGYRERVLTVLKNFDAKAKTHRNTVKHHIRKAKSRFEAVVRSAQLSDDDKKQLLARAKAQLDNLFPDDTA